MKKEILFGIVGVVVGVVLVSLFSSGTPFASMMRGGDYSNNFSNVNSPISGSTAGMVNNIDRHFIEQMIPHHDGAIAMAELALEKSKRSEIKTLAGAIITAQNKEIIDMTSWYKNWYGKDVLNGNTGMMGGGMMSRGGMHMGGQEDIKALEVATDFDKAFIEGMIPHHQMAIMMANMLQSGTNRPEMQQLAKNIISSQAKEIEQMQGWYKNWYK